jgi:hypothetical protein
MRRYVELCTVTNVWQEHAAPILNVEGPTLKMEAWRHITEDSSLRGRRVRTSNIKKFVYNVT